MIKNHLSQFCLADPTISNNGNNRDTLAAELTCRTIAIATDQRFNQNGKLPLAAEECVVSRHDGARVPGEPVPTLRGVGPVERDEACDPGVVRAGCGELVEDGGQPFEGVVGVGAY
jgi:hypothetical protein